MYAINMAVLIVARELKEKFAEVLASENVQVTLSVPGRGTATSETLDFLGLESSERMVFFSIVTEESWTKLKKILYRDMYIGVPGVGVAFLMPLSSIGGRRTLQYLTDGQEVTLKEESALQNTNYELLIIIANSGSIDIIMDAARSAKATGGTVLHAKGTGAEQAKKFLGISLAEEKEMAFVVVRTTRKNDVMRAVMEQAGAPNPAGAIVFSVPVTDTAGIRLPEEDEA